MTLRTHSDTLSTMRNTYRIRNALPEEAPLLAQAQRDVAQFPGRLASRPDELKDENFKEKIKAISQIDTGLFLVIEDNGAIVGQAIVEPHKLAVTSHVITLTIVIHEGHQGKGLGRILMEHLIQWAKVNQKIEKFELQVRSSNVRAIHLYKSLGFIEEGRKTKRLKYGPNEYQDDIYMALWVGE